MLLFSLLTLITIIWVLQLANSVRIISNSSDALKEEIGGAAASCGVSMN
jgi:hypothetical protein